LDVAVDEVFGDDAVETAPGVGSLGVGEEDLQVGFPDDVAGGEQEDALGHIGVQEEAIFVVVMGLADLGGVAAHEGGDVVWFEPEFDLALGVFVVSGGVDEVVHAIVDLVAVLIEDGDEGAQGAQAAGPFVSGLVGVGRAGHLAHGLQRAGAEVDDGNDAAFPAVPGIVQGAHDVIEQGDIEQLKALLKKKSIDP